jgi:signal transduction histidine kinase
MMEFEIIKKLIKYKGEDGYMIVVNNLTSDRLAKEAKQIDESSQVMMATTAHDLRTPLNAVNNMLNML